MDKQRFYAAAKDVLLDELNRADRMPRNVLFFIWPEVDLKKRQEISAAIASNVDRLDRDWNDASARKRPEAVLFFVTGVCFTLAVIGFLVWHKPYGVVAAHTHANDGREFVEVLAGWLVASIGTASVLEPYWSSFSVWLILAWGVVCTLVAQYLVVARRSFERAAEQRNTSAQAPTAQT